MVVQSPLEPCLWPRVPQAAAVWEPASNFFPAPETLANFSSPRTPPPIGLRWPRIMLRGRWGDVSQQPFYPTQAGPWAVRVLPFHMCNRRAAGAPTCSPGGGGRWLIAGIGPTGPSFSPLATPLPSLLFFRPSPPGPGRGAVNSPFVVAQGEDLGAAVLEAARAGPPPRNRFFPGARVARPLEWVAGIPSDPLPTGRSGPWTHWTQSQAQAKGGVDAHLLQSVLSFIYRMHSNDTILRVFCPDASPQTPRELVVSLLTGVTMVKWTNRIFSLKPPLVSQS